VERHDHRHLPLIFVTSFGNVCGAVQAMKAGAVEFLTKPFMDQQLLCAIPLALERSRNALIQKSVMTNLRDRHGSLIDRQREVMKLVVSGLLNKQIAAELGITDLMVKVHRGRIMHKMEADSLAALVTMAVQLQLVFLRSRRQYGRSTVTASAIVA
jgi:FixJ family two-component response regulator